jgi:hypothetical protein
MGLKSWVRERIGRDVGFIAWLRRGGWKTLARTGLEIGADVRRRRHGPGDRIAEGMDVAHDALDPTGSVGDGTE